MAAEMQDAGTGENLFAAGDVKGKAQWFRSPADVLAADEDELGELIAFVEKGGATFMSPIHADLAAVVCTAGTLESHLAIVSREVDVPCVMGVSLSVEIADGDQISLDLSDSSVATVRVVKDGVAA
jgi:phosphohistidine swiveling domain-containing protein